MGRPILNVNRVQPDCSIRFSLILCNTVMDSVFNSLVVMCEQIPQLKLQIRGTGRSRFIYAVTEHRAVELSTETSGFLFEAWNHADEASDEPSTAWEHLDSVQEVEVRLRHWIENVS